MRCFSRFALAASLLSLPGCLEIEQTVTLAADGSGRLEFAMAMREVTIAEVRQAGAAAQLGGAFDPTAVFDKEKTERELVAAGFVPVSHVAEQNGSRRNVKLCATFADFATLQRNPVNGTQAEWELAKGPKAGTAKLTFYPQGRAAWIAARDKAEQLRDEVDPIVAEFFRKRQQQLAGLDLALRIAVPGEVYMWTKNMSKTGEREVTAHVRAADIRTPEDLVRRLAPRFELIFDARGLDLALE